MEETKIKIQQRNLNIPIPTVEFPTSKISVGSPSQEKLVYLNNYFVCDSQYNHWKEDNGKPLAGSSPYIAVRETVLKKLKKAESFLPDGYRFKIYDAYRPIAVQQSLWDYFRAKEKAKNPHLSEEEIDKRTSFCVSFPSYNILHPSLHNTGGAVDLTIIDKNGNELDMGCEFDDFTEKAWTNHFEPDCYNGERNFAARNNRRMLYNAMISAGFTNLPSEWWHFDYGDDKWAQLNNTQPIYAGILAAEIKETVPYPNMRIVKEADILQQKQARAILQAQEVCKNSCIDLENVVKYAKEENVEVNVNKQMLVSDKEIEEAVEL